MTARKLKSLEISEALGEAMAQLAKEDRSRVVHVIPSRKKWVVKRGRARRAFRVLPVKSEAVELARSLARRLDGEVIVHREDGTMQEWQVLREGRLQTVYTYGEA